MWTNHPRVILLLPPAKDIGFCGLAPDERRSLGE
jgi:hypothetical protein